MKKLAAVVILLCLAGIALAATAPVVSTPKDGDKLGSNVYITLKTEGKQFIIVITDVFVNQKQVGSVPGIRHWTDDNGDLTVRVATPRVLNAKKEDLVYKIRVFTATAGGDKGPETVVTCTAE